MLLRILVWGLYPLRPVYVPFLIFISIATMTGANLAALTQNNLKRLLAYSSIAHVGYMLLGLIAGDSGISFGRWREGHPDLSVGVHLHESRARLP